MIFQSFQDRSCHKYFIFSSRLRVLITRALLSSDDLVRVAFYGSARVWKYDLTFLQVLIDILALIKVQKGCIC